jgi:hypothetical protein
VAVDFPRFGFDILSPDQQLLCDPAVKPINPKAVGTASANNAQARLFQIAPFAR